jgi:hypothetical protein
VADRNNAMAEENTEMTIIRCFKDSLVRKVVNFTVSHL